MYTKHVKSSNSVYYNMSNQLHPAERLLIAMDALPFDRDHFSNNNNQNTLWIVRDRLFQVLFEKVTVAYAATFGSTLRKLIEVAVLAIALISLAILFYIHFAFVRVPVTCLENETKTWTREGVLRIEISLEEPMSIPVDASKYCNKIPVKSNAHKIIQVQNQALLSQSKVQDKYVSKITESANKESNDHILDAEKSPEFINRTGPFDSVFDPDCLSPVTTTLSESEIYTSVERVEEKYIIEYALEYGFLRLSPATRSKMGVEIHTVVLDPLKDKCFGSNLSQFLLKYLLGYSDLLMGSLRYLVENDIDKGFVRNVITGEQYRFVDKNASWTAYINAFVVMVSCTLAVSMLLRYSHHQIFLFVVELFHTLELNSSLNFPVTQIFTVILALVGMEAMMSEFFNDSITAFYIIIIVWIADQYDSICCRSSVSKRHWLRFFYLYHFAFYAYHSRFNGQYSSLTLVTSWLFIQHSMLYFFHRYELPAVLQAHEQDLDYDSDTSYQSENRTARSPSEGNEAPTTEQREQSANTPQSPTNVSDHDDSVISSTNRNNDSNSSSGGRNRRRGGSKQARSASVADRNSEVS